MVRSWGKKWVLQFFTFVVYYKRQVTDFTDLKQILETPVARSKAKRVIPVESEGGEEREEDEEDDGDSDEEEQRGD